MMCESALERDVDLIRLTQVLYEAVSINIIILIIIRPSYLGR